MTGWMVDQPEMPRTAPELRRCPTALSTAALNERGSATSCAGTYRRALLPPTWGVFMTSASILIVMIVAIVIGGLTGMVLGGSVSIFVLALAAGFLGVIGAAIARNYVLVRIAGSGPDDSGIPGIIVVFAAVASIAGSLAAEDINESLLHLSPAMVGAFAGLISSVLMVMLMVTYHMNPDKPGNKRFS